MTHSKVNRNLTPSLLGTWVSGDLAGLTIYTTKKGKKVWYQEAPAMEPPTLQQQIQRNRFLAAQALWSSLTPSQKKAYEDAARAASLVMTGQNLFMSVALRNKQDSLATLENQTGIQLTRPPSAPQTTCYRTAELYTDPRWQLHHWISIGCEGVQPLGLQLTTRVNARENPLPATAPVTWDYILTMDDGYGLNHYTIDLYLSGIKIARYNFSWNTDTPP